MRAWPAATSHIFQQLGKGLQGRRRGKLGEGVSYSSLGPDKTSHLLLLRLLEAIPSLRATITGEVPVRLPGSTGDRFGGGRSAQLTEAQGRCLVIRAQAETHSSYCPKPAPCGCAPTVVATSCVIKMYFLSLTFARRPLIGGWTRNLGHFISPATSVNPLLSISAAGPQFLFSKCFPLPQGCPFQARLAVASVG